MAKFKLGISGDFSMITIYFITYISCSLSSSTQISLPRSNLYKYIFVLESGKNQNEILLDK